MTCRCEMCWEEEMAQQQDEPETLLVPRPDESVEKFRARVRREFLINHILNEEGPLC